MKTFAQNLASLMPAGITLPPELIEAFDWLEDQGWHHVRGEGAPEEHWLSIYPAKDLTGFGASHVSFGGSTLPYTGHWSTPNPAIDARIAEIAVSSGDGGRVAIWLDEAGKQHFVHIGHDSLGVISDDPVVVLRFLAMGYPEPGALERTDITPHEAVLEYHGIEQLSDLVADEQPIMPTVFQAFLEQRFGAVPARTARDLGIADFTLYHDETGTDPFARWITAHTPPPSDADLAYELELMRTVESLDIKDTDSPQTIMDKIGTLFGQKK